LGDDVEHISTARIIAATNADLKEKIKDGKFRRDLYERFVHKLKPLPPLRERREDIAALLKHFIEKSGQSRIEIKQETVIELESILGMYHFPGNVRELENMVQEAVSRYESEEHFLSYFREYIQNHSDKTSLSPGAGRLFSGKSISYYGAFPTLNEVERYFLSEAMEKAKNNKTIAARLLGITHFTLNRRLKKHTLE
jgi:DNA-binding NtrC family response regulator